MTKEQKKFFEVLLKNEEHLPTRNSGADSPPESYNFLKSVLGCAEVPVEGESIRQHENRFEEGQFWRC